ncbi:MAG: hypothetical protein HYS45_02840 [Parcubacteria group bacterium]|nr:hypothetical protein [Parcubacteria group bacterium]
MEETASPQPENGFLLIASLLVLSTMMVIVSFYLSAVSQDVRVGRIVDTSPQAYYLAEAGIQEAYWKLANDVAYQTSFETNPSWSQTFTRSDTLIPGSSYTVSIENTGLAEATITATSTIAVRDAVSQRVVRANAFKALSPIPTVGIAAFAKGELYGAGSNVSATGGDFFSNGDIDLNFFSSWTTDQDALAVADVAVSVSSSLTAANTYDQSNPPPPLPIEMPQVDFDSADPLSFKSRADQTYTANEFKTLLKDFPVTTLSGITYVTGNADIKKGTTLTVNGALVSDGSINIGNGFAASGNPATVLVNKTQLFPSGLIAKNDVTIGGFSADVDVAGLIYAGGELRIQDGIFQNVTLDVVGGIIAQDIDVLVAWQPITITHNQTNINEALGEPVFSQVLLTSHWEEQY